MRESYRINGHDLITPHFTYREAVYSDWARSNGVNNKPDFSKLCNIYKAAQGLEEIRAKVLNDSPIIVNSWFRSHQVNRGVGGVANSDHLNGWAVDFTARKFGTVDEVYQAIKESGIKFDQLINELGRWVHVSFAPDMRQQAFHVWG